MAKNTVGWNREDFEALQAIDNSPGSMLHPASPPDNHQHYSQQQHGQQHYNEQYNEQYNYQYHHPQQPAKGTTPVTLVAEARHEARIPGSEPRILGLRRTTFFLTVSNILLAIGLIVLGVVQNHALKNNSGASTALEAQGSCPK
jgi:hypothetical protein